MLNVYLAHTNFGFGQLVVLGKKICFGDEILPVFTSTRTCLPARFVDHPSSRSALPVIRHLVLLRGVWLCNAGDTN